MVKLGLPEGITGIAKPMRRFGNSWFLLAIQAPKTVQNDMAVAWFSAQSNPEFVQPGEGELNPHRQHDQSHEARNHVTCRSALAGLGGDS
jgi:hypothetical protein